MITTTIPGWNSDWTAVSTHTLTVPSIHMNEARAASVAYPIDLARGVFLYASSSLLWKPTAISQDHAVNTINSMCTTMPGYTTDIYSHQDQRPRGCEK